MFAKIVFFLCSISSVWALAYSAENSYATTGITQVVTSISATAAATNINTAYTPNTSTAYTSGNTSASIEQSPLIQSAKIGTKGAIASVMDGGANAVSANYFSSNAYLQIPAIDSSKIILPPSFSIP